MMSKKRKISDSEKEVAHLEEEQAKLQKEGKTYFFTSEYFRINKDAQNIFSKPFRNSYYV